MSIQQKCKVEGCGNLGRLNKNGKRYFVKGLCNAHWIRQNRHGDVNHTIQTKHKHGGTKHPLYSTWEGMNQRCNNPNHRAYKHYGGRGIKICDRWKNFANFLEDMGEKPSEGYTLDRIDNDGNYEPSNCAWATRTEQMMNQRIRATNTSGYKGVSYDSNKRLWCAVITINYKNIHLGASVDKDVALKIRYAGERVYQLMKKQNPSSEGQA